MLLILIMWKDINFLVLDVIFVFIVVFLLVEVVNCIEEIDKAV